MSGILISGGATLDVKNKVLIIFHKAIIISSLSPSISVSVCLSLCLSLSHAHTHTHTHTNTHTFTQFDVVLAWQGVKDGGPRVDHTKNDTDGRYVYVNPAYGAQRSPS